LLGFVKDFGLASVSQLEGNTLIPLSPGYSKLLGSLWLLSCLLFLGTAISFTWKKETWWIVALPAVLLSQLLIILYWPDAKYGTLANIIISVGIVFAFASWNFQTRVSRELTMFIPSQKQEQMVVSEKTMTILPPIVQKWLQRTHILGKEKIHTVYLKQKGKMRTTPEGNWMPVVAEEYFTIDQPGFFWMADVKAAPFIHLYGRDQYENGKGQMLIKLLSLITVADAKGEKTDQGTLLRYLGEIVWFPSAALSEYINWEEIDATSARATMSYGGIQADGVFTFTPAGDIISFEALRYYDRKEGASLEKWFISIDEDGYKEFEGIRIPAKCSVTWKLKDGDFQWFILEITDVDYNPLIHSPEVFAFD
jgi:hypothetical protein